MAQRGWEDLGYLAEGQNSLSLSAESSCPWLVKGSPSFCPWNSWCALGPYYGTHPQWALPSPALKMPRTQNVGLCFSAAWSCSEAGFCLFFWGMLCVSSLVAFLMHSLICCSTLILSGCLRFFVRLHFGCQLSVYPQNRYKMGRLPPPWSPSFSPLALIPHFTLPGCSSPEPEGWSRRDRCRWKKGGSWSILQPPACVAS